MKRYLFIAALAFAGGYVWGAIDGVVLGQRSAMADKDAGRIEPAR